MGLLSACGARSSAGVAGQTDAGIAWPDVSPRADQSKPPPPPPDQGVPDLLQPDLPPAPAGWFEVAVSQRGVVEDIRGASDDAMWMAGHHPATLEGACWILEPAGFRLETLPTPFPVHGVWGRSATDLWAVGKREELSEEAVWHRGAGGRWNAEHLPSPTRLDLLAIDGAANGEFFAVGRTGNIGVALHRSANGSWDKQLFSDAFQWIEARDIVMLGPGEAYAVGQRSSRARFWFFQGGVWLHDQSLLGVANTVGAVGPRDGGVQPAIYAGGNTLLLRNAQSDWLPVADAPKPQSGSIRRLRGNAIGLWWIDSERLWGRREGEAFRSTVLPAGEKPRTLWVGTSWIWVATQTGRVFRHHVLSF